MPITEEQASEAARLIAEHGGPTAAAAASGIPKTTLLRRAAKYEGEPPEVTNTSSVVMRDINERKLRAQLKALSDRYQVALQELDAANMRLELCEPLGGAKPREIPKTPTDSTGSAAVIVMCDWHIEEKIDPKTINGLNEFNLNIAESRVKTAFSRSLALIDGWRRTWKVDEIYLALLGDLITGYIHEELEESNYLSPTEALLFCEQLIVDGINFLIKESGIKRIIVPTCHGNHGRTTKRKRIKTGYKNSFEWLLYNQLARLYQRSTSKVEFRIANGIHNFQTIKGHVVRFHHGDAIKYQGGVGGITIPVNKAIAAWNKSRTVSLDVFGHWHQYLDTWNFVGCGCLCGPSEYSVEIKADYQPPTQTVILMSRSYGKVAALPVYLE